MIFRQKYSEAYKLGLKSVSEIDYLLQQPHFRGLKPLKALKKRLSEHSAQVKDHVSSNFSKICVKFDAVTYENVLAGFSIIEDSGAFVDALGKLKTQFRQSSV